METRCSEDDSCFMESDDVIVIVITETSMRSPGTSLLTEPLNPNPVYKRDSAHWVWDYNRETGEKKWYAKK